MVDWTSSMQQYFEYYIVDPGTWRDAKKLSTVRSCTITRDAETDTLGSAAFDMTDLIGECYIRVYLVTIQNGVTEKHPLGTFLVQTPNTNFDGKVQSISVDAYTPLIELKENDPVPGYFTPKYVEGDPNALTILEHSYLLSKEHARAPVVKVSVPTKLQYDFVAETNESWLTYNKALLANANYEYTLDELGRISFAPIQEIDSLQPRWTFDDGNSSILYPELSINHDMFGIPNVVEVTHVTPLGKSYTAISRNDDAASPVSTVSRGRELIHRITNPDALGDFPHETQIDSYADNILKTASTLQCSVTYTHGYCPVRLGDGVRLNYTKAGLTNIKAKVISQNIKCVPGCQVQEKAIFNVKLWR